MQDVTNISSDYAAQVAASLQRIQPVRVYPSATTLDYASQSRGIPSIRRNHKTGSLVFDDTLIAAQLA